MLVKGGKPIRIGLNKEKQGYTKDPIYRLKCIHAELDLLCNLPEHVIKNGIIYVGGITKGGSVNISKPCPTCQKYLKKFNIKAVVYSMPDGSYEKLIV